MQLNQYENQIQYDPATEVRHKKEVFSASDVSPESPTQDSNEADHIIYHKSKEEKRNDWPSTAIVYFFF